MSQAFDPDELPLFGLDPPASQYGPRCYVRGTIESINFKESDSVLRLGLRALKDVGRRPTTVLVKGPLASDAHHLLHSKIGRRIRVFLVGLALFPERQPKDSKTLPTYGLGFQSVFKGVLLSRDGDEEDDEPFELGESQLTSGKRQLASATSTGEASREETPQPTERSKKKQRSDPEQNLVSSSSLNEVHASSTESSEQMEKVAGILSPSHASNGVERQTKSLHQTTKRGNKNRPKAAAAAAAANGNKNKWPAHHEFVMDDVRRSAYAAMRKDRVLYEPLALIDLGATNSTHNIICRAAGEHEPGGGKFGNDFFLSLRLFDVTCFDEESRVLKQETCQDCRLFFKNAGDMPQYTEQDVLVLQNVNYNKGKRCFSGYSTKWRCTVITPEMFSSAKNILPQLPLPTPYNKFADVTAKEIDLARKIFKWTKSRDTPNGTFAPVSSRDAPAGAAERSGLFTRASKVSARRTVPVEALHDMQFIDLVAIPLRFFPPQTEWARSDCYFEGPLSVFVTDYSKNDELYSYDCDSDFPPPELKDQRVLQISVFGKRNIDVLAGCPLNEPVFFRNIVGRYNTNNFLEARLHEDKMRSHTVDVRRIFPPDCDEHIQAIRARLKTLQGQTSTLPEPRSSTSAHEPPVSLALPSATLMPVASASGKVPNSSHVRIVDGISLPVKSIGSLLKAPTAEAVGNHTVRGRVVDYSPPDLRDWIVAFCSECSELLEPGLIGCLAHSRAEVEVYVHAILYIQDDSISQPVPIRLSLCDPKKSLAGLELSASDRVRNEDTAAFREFAGRWRPLLGHLEQLKRHHKPITRVAHGPDFDFQVSIEPAEGSTGRDAVDWFWAESKMTVESPL
ncbi:hypothetical protein OIV83_002716 [Microbotryomycetes sp. JL201]|nr:hypothetical protein OIV83_002716 [Microbotryomycetes sp. JL201]